MALEFRIHWDGDAPGISEHRLSLSAFGEPLRLLLAAYRRIASRMLKDAEEPATDSVTGRLANEARLLDIEIQSIDAGSVGVSAALTMTEPLGVTIALFPDLASRAGAELLESLEAESSGRLRNSAVRKYLTSLPASIRRQSYVLSENGAETRRVEFGELQLAPAPTDLPFLSEVVGEVVEVGFEPGRSEIRLKGKSTVAMQAAQELVEMALAHRGEELRALSLRGIPNTRVIRLERSSDPKYQVTQDRIERHIFNRWNGVLERLAR